MKKHLKLLPLILGSVVVLAGCNDFTTDLSKKLPSTDEMGIDTPWTDYSNPCTSILFGKGETNLELKKGDTHTYSYTVEPKDINKSLLVWESDNTSVATIENGVLTAVGGGKANISLSCGDVKARSLVNVTVPINDFNVVNKDISIDIEGQSQIEYVLDPADTTQNKISYETESSIISVSDSGLITALGTIGDAEVKVTNEGLNKVETINVHVVDSWNYVSMMTLSGPKELEVNKSGNLSCDVIGIDSSKEASALTNNKIVYSVKQGSETYVSVDPESGEITGLEPGNATLVATLVDERHPESKAEEQQNKVTSEVNVQIFEVSATAIELSESGTIELDNDQNTSHQLVYSYTLDNPSFDEPSRGKLSFITSNKDVATVNDNGLIEVVGPGTATITVKDLTYDVSDSIDVHSTIYAKSVTLAASGDFYLDESIEITANVVPAVTSDELVWEYDEASGHTFVKNGNKLTVTCNNLDTPIEVKASVGLTQSNVLTLTPKEREVLFENGKTYIVGSSNFKTGVSKDVEGGSWNAAKYAFVMTDKTGNPNAKYEYKAVIEFRANDEWKIREHESTWRAISGTNGRYKVNEGAFKAGQMSVTGTPEDGNVLVNVAGVYDVYYAYYDDTETGWYDVYVEEHGMKLSSVDVHAKLTDQTTVSTITASNYEGTLTVSDVDEEFITVSVDALTGNISITPVKVGNTSFKVKDDVKEIEVSVEIKEGSDAKTTAYYIRGDAANGWGDVSDDYVLRESTNPNNIGEILDVYLKAGNFKIADKKWESQWGYDYNDRATISGGAAANFSKGSSDNNITCNVAGYYNIYLTVDNYISIESVGGDDPVTFMWGIVGNMNEWTLDAEYPFVESSTEGDAKYTYKLSGFEFAIDDEWKVKNTNGEWVNNQERVGFDLEKSTSGAFSITEGGNIKVLTAGTYDITLNIWEGAKKDEGGFNFIEGVQIYAIEQVGPGPTPIDPTSVSIDQTGPITIKNGKTSTLTATIGPDGASGKLVWSSNNSDVLSVDENTGVVTCKADSGSATISVKVSGFDSVNDSITVNAAPDVFMWGIVGSGNNWTLDEANPFIVTSAEGDAKYTYKLCGFEFAIDDEWKVKNTNGEWVNNQEGVGFDLSKSTSGAFSITEGGNIKVLTAGTYDITLNIWEGAKKDDGGFNFIEGVQIYAVEHVAPAAPSISFGVSSPEVAVDGSLEIPVTATNCSDIGYYITEGNEFIAIDPSSDDTKLVVNGLCEGSSTVLARAIDGTENTIAIECVESVSPTPVGDTDYVILVQHKDSSEWNELAMSQTGDIETQYEYTGNFTEGDIIKIHMSGDTYYCFDDIKSGSPALTNSEISCANADDIKFNKTGNYSIYSDSVNYNGHIWIKRNIAPATMTIEGSDPVTMDVHEGVDGEYMLLNVELETNEFFSFEYDGTTVGYDNLKSDSSADVKSNLAKHIAVTEAGSYDIYFDTSKIGGECLKIVKHSDVVTYTVKFVVNYNTFENGDLYFMSNKTGWEASVTNMMHWDTDNNWYFELTLEANTAIEFKFYTTYPYATNNGWESSLGNRTYTFTKDEVVNLTWGNY